MLGLGKVKSQPVVVNGPVEDLGNKGANVRPCDVTPEVVTRENERVWCLQKGACGHWSLEGRNGTHAIQPPPFCAAAPAMRAPLDALIRAWPLSAFVCSAFHGGATIVC